MEFCAACGTRLRVQTCSPLARLCPTCGTAFSVSPAQTRRSGRPIRRPHDPVIILDESVSRLRTVPTVRVTCERCGGNHAETWSVTNGSDDISHITVYTCTACGRSWRESDRG